MADSPTSARRASFLWEKASATQSHSSAATGVASSTVQHPPALMLPERHLQQCQRRQVSVQLNSLPAAAVHPCAAQQLRFYFLRPAGGRGRGAPAPRRPHVGRDHRCSRRPRRVNEKRDPQQLAHRMRPAAQVPEPAISTPGAESWVAGVVHGVMGRCSGLVWTAQHAHQSPQRAVEVVKMEVSITTAGSSNWRYSQETTLIPPLGPAWCSCSLF